MISVPAIIGVLMMAGGMAFIAFGLTDGRAWDRRVYAALAMIVIGLMLTVWFGVIE